MADVRRRYGKRYVFGLVDRTTLSAQFRVNYTFKPDVTLDVYAEPFAASGQYRGFGELAAARSRNLRIYGTDGTTITRLADGSYIGDRRRVDIHAQPIAISTSARFAATSCCGGNGARAARCMPSGSRTGRARVTQGDHVGVGDLFGSLSAPGDNIFAIKTTIWLSR